MQSRVLRALPCAAPFALAALLLVPSLGCKKLLELAQEDEAKDSAAETGASTPEADAAVTAESTATTPSSTPADDLFSAPGACVDPKADILKRASGSGAPQSVETFDLDGDGKPDKVVHLDLGADSPSSIFAYVMRGTCGHFVGQFSASSLKLSGSKSKGLKSFEVFEKDATCADDCKCSDRSTAVYFNGNAYQAGKAKAVPRKCIDAGPAAGGPASAGTRGAACKLPSDCTAPLKCAVAPGSAKGKASCEKACRQGSDCGDDERCIPANASSPVSTEICVHIDCASIAPGSVMVNSAGDHECATPCKTDATCPTQGRPRQCAPGYTQLKPRHSVSVCFPL